MGEMNRCGVTVFGLGKIGLPLAVQFALKGCDVVGIDVKPELVESINRGEEPFPGELNLSDYLKTTLKNGNFQASLNDAAALGSSDVVIVAVPLIVDDEGKPNFSYLDDVTFKIGKSIRKGTLICYETTLPLGSTRDRFLRKIEEISGLSCPNDFNLVFSPERVSSGRIFSDLRKYPKIVGGITDKCTERATKFYESVLDFDVRNDLGETNGVWKMGSSEEAEFVKLAETTYRDVNIALANQFALDANTRGLDIGRIINSANSQPYSMIHNPGISVGGHCIPVYPLLYLSTNPGADLIRVARELNNEMPAKAIKRIQEVLGNLSGEVVAVFGVSYRPGVKETAFSGAFRLKTELQALGAKPVFIIHTFKQLKQ